MEPVSTNTETRRRVEQQQKELQSKFPTNPMSTAVGADVRLSRRLKMFIDNWKSITNDEFLLEVISGFTIPFRVEPFQRNEPHELKLERDDKVHMDLAIDALMKSGAIVESKQENGQFVSNIFPVQKSDGSVSLVINLKSRNE